MKKSVIFILIFLVATLPFFTACNSAKEQKENILTVVCTTTFVHNLSDIIGGENISAIALMPSGVDPHLYKASAGDVDKIQNADVLVYNGMHLEGKMEDLFANLKSDSKEIICIENAIAKTSLIYYAQSETMVDPHIWFDVSLWQSVAEHLAQEFARIDPQNADSYFENCANYKAELSELDAYIKTKISELPEQQRVLVTAHDAFGYFGRAYGFEVLGLQGLNTNSEASTADIINLANYIVENKVKAIFVESSVSPKNIEALQEAVLAKGFEVEIGGQIYSDSLGDANSGHGSYISTFKYNIDTITSALAAKYQHK